MRNDLVEVWEGEDIDPNCVVRVTVLEASVSVSYGTGPDTNIPNRVLIRMQYGGMMGSTDSLIRNCESAEEAEQLRKSIVEKINAGRKAGKV